MRFSFFGAMLLLVGILDVCYGVQFLLTVPKEAYYDADLVVSVTAFGLTQRQKEVVTLEYSALKDTSMILNSTTLEFTSDSSKTWTVLFPWDRIQQIDETGVSLKMVSGDHEVTKALIFTQNFGYIFIQTDKPIYTPMQTVKFRVIAVDEFQKLAKYMIRIDIRNHKLIIVDRMRYTAEEAFKAKEFELPKETPPGEWSITANFEGMDHTPGAIHTATFEVREYVLPRFSSTVSVDPDVITMGTQWVTVNITSRYVYGRPLQGSVELKLGIWESNNSVHMLPVNYTEQLVNGQFIKDIRVSQMFPPQMLFTRNNRLYVKATVTESTSLESYVVEDTSTFISHPLYIVDFKLSKKYFKPGYPYTFQAQVSAQSGRPASWVNLHVLPMFFNYQKQHIGGSGKYYILNEHGELKQDFDIPPEAYEIQFAAIVADPKVEQLERHMLRVKLFPSSNNQYLHISLATPIQKNRDGIVLLRYTKPNQPAAGSSYKPDSITILVLAKGHIIYTTTSIRNQDGQSNVALPFRLYTEISPNMRIVAYFHEHSKTSEVVLDSLLVDTPDVCLEEIFLTPADGHHSASSLYKPKDRYILEVDGTPNMNVGFVAVDKAVFYLNNKQTLTRNLLFGQLGSHDRGIGNGDGNSMKEILENSGLHYLTIDTDIPVIPSLLGILHSIEKEVNRVEQSTRVMLNGNDREQLSLSGDPPQSVRNYFPESWFFEERRLPQTGYMSLNLTLPDSITTWSFLAVGISSNRGVCVSHPLEQRVMKLFFADVSLPYKATRLEEVKVKISVYNYQIYAIEVNVVVTGSEGLCFSANSVRGSTQNSTTFKLSLPAGQARGMAVKVIPLKIGDITLRVDLQNQHEKDIVEKKLHVVAEGQRVKKSITFVLDPEAKHATFKPSKKNKTALYESLTINNVFDLNNKEQQTTIDLALPANVIRGTESCRISAFGDLMGDIITHAVVESRNLIDTYLVNAEEVLGDLAPTIHALHSANKFGLMDEQLTERGNKFVKRGITRLLKYRQDNYSFSLTTTSKSSTWLTAFVLKTLCHARDLVFIDRDNLINRGFVWLLAQVLPNGALEEQDRRKINISPFEYNMTLTAEALIAIMECGMLEVNSQLQLPGKLFVNLKNYFRLVKDPLILAKVTYALMLFNETSEEYQEAVKRLHIMKRRNSQGHNYWSKVQEPDESKRTSFYWYHNEIHASAIEATAYALIVFLKHGGTNIDAIADWLVGQRNYNGALTGALDSTAAIQALSKYSFQKHGPEVNLHCNVSIDTQKDHFYLFKFTEENAFHRESLNNVPVGRVLDVLTQGQGLGQMQINIEYNIPIDKNHKCSFYISANTSKTVLKWGEDMQRNPLCSFCDIGCVKPVILSDSVPHSGVSRAYSAVTTTKPAGHMRVKGGNGNKNKGNGGKNKNKPKNPRNENKKPKTGGNNPKPKTGGNNPKPKVVPAKQRPRRALEDSPVASKKSICVHVCLQHLEQGVSQPIEVRIHMLTGYQPVMDDIERIKNVSDVQYVAYDIVFGVLTVQFSKISCTEKTCVAFRAVDEGETRRLMPANVEIIPIGKTTPECVAEYKAIPDDQSLQVYCADFSNSNKGECRCYSGLCSFCKPSGENDLDLFSVRQLVCKNPIAYQLQIANVTEMDEWVEINSRVLSLNKTGSDNIETGSIIKMMTPKSCFCPTYKYNNTLEKFYLLSADVEKMVDRNGNYVYRYLLDEQSWFLQVAAPGVLSTPNPSVPHYYLQEALSSNNKCVK